MEICVNVRFACAEDMGRVGGGEAFAPREQGHLALPPGQAVDGGAELERAARGSRRPRAEKASWILVPMYIVVQGENEHGGGGGLRSAFTTICSIQVLNDDSPRNVRHWPQHAGEGFLHHSSAASASRSVPRGQPQGGGQMLHNQTINVASVIGRAICRCSWNGPLIYETPARTSS